MRHTRTWLYVFLPFLYLAIVLGLVAVQFSKKTDSFSQSLGDLTLSGKNASGGQPAELTLRGRNLVFLFDANHYLQVESKDGTTARLRPQSWAWKDGNVQVTFQQGVQLAFEKSENARALLIRPLPNSALANLAVLHIPFAPEGGVRMNRGNRVTTVELVKDKNHLLASVDGARDRIEMDNTFVLTAGKEGFRPARVDPLAAGIDTDLAWLNLDEPATRATAETALGQYWDKAYAGWAASNTFSSALADAWGREALARNEFPVVSSKLQALLGRDRRAWTFDSAPFLGNIVEITAQQRRAVESASSRSQPDWAGQPRLWSNARFYGPEGSSDRVRGLLVSGKLPEAPAALAALLRNLLDIQKVQPSDALSVRVQEVQKALLSSTIRREGQLYVQTREGLLDLRTGLLLGRLWLDYGNTPGNDAYGTAGALLITSALSWQDSAGHLPEVLVTQDGLVVRHEGSLLAEDLYPLLRPAPDRETDLAEWGPGAFVMTPAKLTAKEISKNRARFTLRFPVGTAEHVVISGVPAFDHITMHGIRWRTDPQFQAYTDGWAYSAATKTLYMKIKHREDLEEVVIQFQTED